MDGKNEVDQLSKMMQLLGCPTVSQWPVRTALTSSKVIVLTNACCNGHETSNVS